MLNVTPDSEAVRTRVPPQYNGPIKLAEGVISKLQQGSKNLRRI